MSEGHFENDQTNISEMEMLKEQIVTLTKEFMSNGIFIEDNGVYKKESSTSLVYNPSNNTLENIKRLMKEIPLLFQKNKKEKKYWNTNSNTGKEKIEEWRKYKEQSDTYTPHGDFIIAMLLLDYEFRNNYEKKYPQMTFNATYRNIMKYSCECGLEFTKATEIQHKKSILHKTIMKRINNAIIKEMEKPIELNEVDF